MSCLLTSSYNYLIILHNIKHRLGAFLHCTLTVLYEMDTEQPLSQAKYLKFNLAGCGGCDVLFLLRNKTSQPSLSLIHTPRVPYCKIIYKGTFGKEPQE